MFSAINKKNMIEFLKMKFQLKQKKLRKKKGYDHYLEFIIC